MSKLINMSAQKDNIMLEYVKCNLCGSDYFNSLCKIEPFNIVKCKKCGLVYVNPRQMGEKLLEKYEQPILEDNFQSMKDQRISNFKRNLYSLRHFKKGGKILDIGCSYGIFLDIARKDGWDTFGVELSKAASTYAKNKLGLNVFCGALEDAKFENSSFDAITMWEVLEHVPDPTSFLKEVNRILKNNGVIGISVPNFYWFYSKNPRMKEEYLKPAIHLFHFSPSTLKKLLLKTGYKVLAINTSNTLLTPLHFQQVGINFDSRLRSILNSKYLLHFLLLIRKFIGKVIPGNRITAFAKKI